MNRGKGSVQRGSEFSSHAFPIQLNECFQRKRRRPGSLLFPPVQVDLLIPIQIQGLHSTLPHLDSWKGGYVRLLFIDYSSAFKTIVPTRLAGKLIELELNTPLCAWSLDLLTARSQVVRSGRHTSNPLTLNTGSPQGCILSRLLYSLYGFT